MLNNHFTLAALAAEIRHEIESRRIAACLTNTPNVLEIVLGETNETQASLVVSCIPQRNYVFLDRHAKRRLRGANVLQEAIGTSIIRLTVLEYDRTIALTLSNENSILINLFGTHANVYMKAPDDRILGRFLKRKSVEPRAHQVTKQSLAYPVNAAEFTAGFLAAPGTPRQRLSRIVPTFTTELSREALYRIGRQPTSPSPSEESHFDETEISSLFDRILEIRQELETPQPRIYFEDSVPILLSLIDMRHLHTYDFEMYASVNSCIEEFVAKSERHIGKAELKDSLLNRLKKKRDDLTKTIRRIDDDMSSGREEKYREYGMVLMQHLNEISKGQITYETRGGDELLHIPLDAKLTPVANAQQYFEKSKKARESHRQAVLRRQKLKGELSKVEEDLKKVETETDYKALGSLERMERTESQPPTPFRHFEIGGYNIFVGKDASNNDELTFGFSKPNDVFLHARGVSGSHVIIRNKSREYPQKRILLSAASIAAYYSKARASKIVPVSYTMKKFVKKAKGKPGAVLLDREEVVFVAPEIPAVSR